MEVNVRYVDASMVQAKICIEATSQRVWDLVIDIELPARLSPELQSGFDTWDTFADVIDTARRTLVIGEPRRRRPTYTDAVASVKNWHPRTVRFSFGMAVIELVLAVTSWLEWVSDRGGPSPHPRARLYGADCGLRRAGGTTPPHQPLTPTSPVRDPCRNVLQIARRIAPVAPARRRARRVGRPGRPTRRWGAESAARRRQQDLRSAGRSRLRRPGAARAASRARPSRSSACRTPG